MNQYIIEDSADQQMEDGYKAAIIVACIAASILMLSLSFESIGEVPSLREIQLPKIELPSFDQNPEITNLDNSFDISDEEASPELKIWGPTGTSYLRLITYDLYSGGSWETPTATSLPYNGEILDSLVSSYNSSQLTTFSIELYKSIGDYLPTAPNTQAISGIDVMEYFEDYQIFTAEEMPETFNITYIDYIFTEEQLTNAETVDIENLLQVPMNLRDKIQPFAEEITQGLDSDYEKLKALEDYLQSNYNYNISAPDAPAGTDPLEYFLFESGEGICTHFNTALALMARSLDIPSQLVGGYYIDPEMPVQNVYPIQKHAFVEVPFQDMGWIIFDATPGSDLEENFDFSGFNLTDFSDLEGLGGLEDLVSLLEDLEISPEGFASTSNIPLFEVLGTPYTRYLRDGVGDYYNGSWFLVDPESRPYTGELIAPTSSYSNFTEVGLIIEPLKPLSGLLLTASNPSELLLVTNSTYFPEVQLFKTNQTIEHLYSIGYNYNNFDYEVLNSLSTVNESKNLQVPSDLNSIIQPLAEQITRNQETSYAKLRTLEGYLESQYTYNFTYTQSPKNMDPVEWFLFYEKQGTCVNFNTAFALLARSIGIPVRMVSGYLVDPDAEAQIIRSNQAHAYVEVHFEELGWVIFDATPPDLTPDKEDTTGKIPTATKVTYQDSSALKGDEFRVIGTVTDDSQQPVTGLRVLVYLKQDKDEAGILSGEGEVTDGIFNVTCLIPIRLEPGIYMVDVHALGNDVYSDSWSDPPLTVSSETEMILDVPQKVIAGRTFNVTGTLKEVSTSQPLTEKTCEIQTDDFVEARVTDNNGRVYATINYPLSGEFDLGITWSGEEYYLGAENHVSISSVSLGISPIQDPVFIRSETTEVSGLIHAEELVGDNEELSVTLDDTTLSTTSGTDGKFTYTYKAPSDRELGMISLEYLLHSNQVTVTQSGWVKARPILSVQVDDMVKTKESVQLHVSLHDDNNEPITGQDLLIEYRYGDTSWNISLVTDDTGAILDEFNIEEYDDEQIHYKVFYSGSNEYIQASAQGNLQVLAPTPFPYLQMIIGTIGVIGLGSLYMLQKRRDEKETIESEPTAISSMNSSRGSILKITLPQIVYPFPYVWGIHDQLDIHVSFETKQEQKTSDRKISLIVSNVLITVPLDEGGNVSKTTTYVEKGVEEIIARMESENIETRIELKIVDYRDEIIHLYNGKFKEATEYFKQIRDNYTARDLLNYLTKITSEETHSSLEEMTHVFEEANYSLHPISRSSYEKFYLAMKQYEEVLRNGEAS